MELTTETRLPDGMLEREFTVDGVPGVLWTPGGASSTTPVPLVLMGHPGGLEAQRPRLVARAASCAANGFAAATTELPGSGDRQPLETVQKARTEVRQRLAEGQRVDDELIDRLILPLVEQAVPECRLTLDALLALPEIGGPVAWSGGVVSIGVRLAVEEPRLVAAGLFAGSFIPRAILELARQVTIPVHVLLQWDDAGNDRQRALELFDAFGSTQKTLQANLGGHTGIPPWAAADSGAFFIRHLAPDPQG